MWTGAILAGGRGRRLGGADKGQLEVGGVSIIERQVACLRPLAEAVLVVTNHPARYTSLDATVVEDRVRDAGPLGGVYTALLSAPTDQVVVVACDMPFVTGPFLQHVASVGQAVPVAIPRSPRGHEPLCASYRREIVDAIARQLARGVLSLHALLAAVPVRTIEPEEIAPFDPDGLLFFNINTPDDYARARALAAARARPVVFA